MAETANRIIKNTGWLYGKMAITMFISLWSTRLVLNSLGASDFGVFNIVGGAIGMLGFLNAAMASSTQRFMSYSEGQGSSEKKLVIFNVSIVLHIFIAFLVGLLLIVGGIIFFTRILNIPEDRLFAAEIVYGSLIVSTVFTVLSVPYDAVMNAHENMRYFAFVGIIESLLKLSAAFFCVYTTYDKLIVYGILMACIPIVSLTIMRVYCHRKYAECKVNLRTYFSKKDAKEIISFAGWNFLGSIATFVGNYGQGIIANVFFGVIVNASMGVVRQLQGQLAVLNSNLLKALNPIITKSEGAGDRSLMIKWTLRGCKFSYIIVVWIVIPLWIEAEYILSIWLKKVPEGTVLFFRLQMIRFLLEQTAICLNTSLSAVGAVKETNLQASILSLVPIFVCYFLFRSGFQAEWLYISFIIVTFIQNFLKAKLCKKYCDINYINYIQDTIAPIFFLTFLMLLIGNIPSVLFGPSFIRLIYTFLFSWIALFIACYIYSLKDEERKYIKTSFIKVYNHFRIYF